MFRKAVLFLFLGLVVPATLTAEESKVIPLTVGELEKWRDPKMEGRWDFVVDFYKRNKAVGATDGQILNELLKFDVKDGKNSEWVEKISMLGKRYKDMEQFAKNIIDNINMKILEKYPGEVDRLIDFDDLSTMKNIKNLPLGKFSLGEFLSQVDPVNYYSNIVKTPSTTAVLASCVDGGKGKILMSFIVSPKKGSAVVTAAGGAPFTPVGVDFSASENMVFGKLYPPFEQSVAAGGKNAFGYAGKFYLPFDAYVQDGGVPSKLKATLTMNVCDAAGCRPETTPEIVYAPVKFMMESVLCTDLTQQMMLSPASGLASVELKRSYFKKNKSGGADLYVVLKPAFYVANPVVHVKNQQGVELGEPFVLEQGGDTVLKMRVLSPIDHDAAVKLTIDVGYDGGAIEFESEAKFTDLSFGRVVSLFSFSVFDFLLSVLSGVKFLFLTPLLTAFLIFGTQLAFAERKSAEKSVDFYNGLAKTGYFWSTVYLLGAACCSLLPEGVFVWGAQFYSPCAVFCWALAFALSASAVSKAFDDTAVIKAFKRLPIRFFQNAAPREQAGLLTGFVTGALLLVTPATRLYFDTYLLLSKSVVLYSVGFAVGVLAPFVALSLMDKRAEGFPVYEKQRKIMAVVAPLPLLAQIAALLAIIRIETDVKTLAVAAVLLAAAVIAVKRVKRAETAIAVVVLAALPALPLFPKQGNLMERLSAPFDETELRRSVGEGKSVILGVGENYCLACFKNMLLTAKAKDTDDVVFMRVNYQNAFVKELLMQEKDYGMPANILFSPEHPEGKVIEPDLAWYTVKDIGAKAAQRNAGEQPEKEREKTPENAEDAEVEKAEKTDVAVTADAPDPQTAPERNPPEPEAAGTD